MDTSVSAPTDQDLQTERSAPCAEPVMRDEHRPDTCQVTPLQPDPPARHEQDTQEVDGEAALHPPPGTDLIQRSKIQG